jgi:hypothetical protein
MTKYQDAAICRRGHVLTSDLSTHGAVSPRCRECGAPILTTCVNCGGRIQGLVVTRYGAVYGYGAPEFCDLCGAPHPWASRQARLYELQNMLDEQDLDEASRLTVREQLEALQDTEHMSEKEQEERWLRIKRLAPGLVSAGSRIVESVASGAIKDALGL